MEVIYTYGLEDCPAAIDRKTGTMYIQPERWKALTPFQQKFVWWHELGHYHLNTDSEILADGYAFDHLAGTEFRSLKQCLECLTEILDINNKTLEPRYKALMNRALQWDYEHGNERAKLELDYLNGNLSAATSILWGLIKVGDTAKEKADAYYRTAQGETLKIHAAYAGQSLLNSVNSTETQVIVIALLIAFYIYITK
ncbi:MAG: hypothetical protein LBB53_01075 [Prevotellaceae bacterium]|jgi:hypothetical protein|nr:hypothetical protein [Prevotellaceae bacterium]